MALHHAVLALLVDGPSYGYELKPAFDAAVGPHWGAMNIGHLYQLLERLARDGFAATSRQPQETKPDRLVYTLTPAGRAELDSWLAEPARRPTGHRDDFFLKLMAAQRLGDEAVLRRVIADRRRMLAQEIRDIAALRSAATDPDPLDRLLALAADLQARSGLELLAHVEAALPELLARRPAAVAHAPVPADPATDAASPGFASAG